MDNSFQNQNLGMPQNVPQGAGGFPPAASQGQPQGGFTQNPGAQPVFGPQGTMNNNTPGQQFMPGTGAMINGQVVPQGTMVSANGQTPNGQVPNGQPGQISPDAALASRSNRAFVWIAVSIVVSLVAVTFIGLFIWMYAQWNEAKTNVEGQINEAVARKVHEAVTETEATFEEREKNPYKTFTGPSDYGSLSFQYPKTWSLYEVSDASSGRDYQALFNPDKIPPTNSETPLALQVNILNESYDSVIEDYTDAVQDGEMTVEPTVIGGSPANIYRGELDNDFFGLIAIFKLRDKTVTIQTDAFIFEDDFRKVLSTVTYNS